MKLSATSSSVLLTLLSIDGMEAFRPTQPAMNARGIGLEMSTVAAAASGQIAMEVDDSDAPPLRRTKPRKICLMVEPTPFTHVSGYSNRFNEMLRYLSKAGDNVEIVTTESEAKIKQKGDELPKEKFGYQIHHTQGFTFPLYDHIALTFDLPEMKGAKVIEKMQPDLIHVTSPGFMCLAGLLYAKVMRVPLVMSYHTHLPLYGRNYLGYIPGIEDFAWWLLRTFHGWADLTLVTSPQIRDEMIANGIPRVDVWRKGIDTVRFDPKFADADMRSRMTDGNPDDFLLVYVGRLGAEKRLKDIRAMLKRMPNSRLCIVGKGPQEKELHDFFKGTRTVFTGQLSGDDLSKAFASADAFVMPSDSETLGFVVLEAMASGVPVVGAKAGGIPNLIDDGVTSFLVPPGDTDAYVNRLTKLQDPALRAAMGKRAREEAERWSWEAATSVLRNTQYERALLNFHSRAFGGLGRPGTKSISKRRIFAWRVRRVMAKLRLPGFSNLPRAPQGVAV